MFADYNYYKTVFGGTKIIDEQEYNYLAKQSSRYIARYTKQVNSDTQDCECALSEYLQSAEKQSGITSESIPNAYSVSYASKDNATKMSEINAILALYLGNNYSAVGIVKVIN